MEGIELKENDLIVHELCPSCDGHKWDVFTKISFRGKTLEYQLCRHCSLLFLNPVPSQDWYNRLYAREFWEAKSTLKSRQQASMNEYQWKKEFLRAEKFIDFLEDADVTLEPGSFILDVGCAYGLVARTLADHFDSTALGVEPSKVARDFCKQFSQVEIVAENMDYLADWKPNTPVELFVFSHVMENIVDLNKVFHTVGKLLKPDGLILMDTPNLFFTNSLHIHHPYCFCEQALYHLFGNHGFHILRMNASGRPNKVLSPKYLTLIARKMGDLSMPGRIRESTAPVESSKIRWGQLYNGVVSRSPLKEIDRFIARRIYPLGSENLKRFESIRAGVLGRNV